MISFTPVSYTHLLKSCLVPPSLSSTTFHDGSISYFLGSWSLLWAISCTVAETVCMVDVRIITPGIPDKKFIYNITRSFYHGLVKHGVRVYEWTPGFCHAKMSVADDCMATCGTINLDLSLIHISNTPYFHHCIILLYL